MTTPSRSSALIHLLQAESRALDDLYAVGKADGYWSDYRGALISLAGAFDRVLRSFLDLQQRHRLFKQEVTGDPKVDGREVDQAAHAGAVLAELEALVGELHGVVNVAGSRAGAPLPPGGVVMRAAEEARAARAAKGYLRDLDELEARLKGEPPTGGYVRRPGTVLPPRDGFVGVAMNSAAPGQTVNVLVNGASFTRKTAKALAASVGAAVKAGDIIFHKDIQMPGVAPAPKQKGKKKKR